MPHLAPPDLPDIREPILFGDEEREKAELNLSRQIRGSALPVERGEQPLSAALAYAPGAASPVDAMLAPGRLAEPPPPAVVAGPKFPPKTVANLREAVRNLRKGDAATAEQLIKELDDPAVTRLAEWIAIRALAVPTTLARIEAFVVANPDWPGATALRRRGESAMFQEKPAREAVVAHFAARPPTTALGRLALARSFDPAKDAPAIAELIRKAWRDDQFGVSLEAQIVSEFGRFLRTEDHRYRMERFLFREKFGDALRAAERAGKDYVALVRARQAVANRGGDGKALLDAVPATLKADSSFAFALAQYHRRRNDAREAAAAMAAVTRDPAILGNGDEWWVERRLVARKLLDMGEAKLAYEVARNHGAETPPMRVEAEFHAGWIALQFLKDAALAAPHFDAAAEIAESPISVARAEYWRGRAADSAGDGEKARQHYRAAAAQSVAYYGQLALARLGSDGPAAIGPRLAQPGASVADAKAIVRALELLYAIGERAMALRMLADAGQESSDVPLLQAMGEVATAEGDARAVLVLGKLATRRGLPIVDHAFPTTGVPAFRPVADPVDPAIVHAIARQESAFDPAAISHAGARGLMQLMPATAKRTADRFKVAFVLPRLTSDAVYNAQIGAAHLRELVEEWKGSLILVFAAYNAGSHNVKKWIAAYGDPRDEGVDAIDWVERIPFTETRNYVQRVVENLQVYRVRLGSHRGVAIAGDLKFGGTLKAAETAP
jgi:soluble lytic murein transglycosylase